MNKVKLTLAAIVLILLQAAKASAAALGITFHFFGSATPSETDLHHLICQLNSIYNESSTTGIHFYMNKIKISSGSPGTQQQAVTMSAPEGHINVYAFAGPTYNPALDAVFFSGVSSVTAHTLAHELGHLLGLLHPNGAGAGAPPASCPCSNPSDPDCVNDTNFPFANNIMNQGSSAGSVFTSGQAARMGGCIGARFWSSNPNFTAVNSNYNYVVPYDHINPGSGNITWTYPTNCGILPIHTQITITTFCESGAVEYQFIITHPDVTMPAGIPLTWGIRFVEFIYTYPGGWTNKVIRTVNWYPPTPGMCTLGGSNSKPSAVGEVTSNISASFTLLNTVATSSLSVVNNRYEKAVIYDLSGRKVSQVELKIGSNNVDISSLATGAYVITATNGAEQVRCRFVKQ